MAGNEKNATMIEKELENYDNDQILGLALIGLDKLRGQHPNLSSRPITAEEILRLKSS